MVDHDVCYSKYSSREPLVPLDTELSATVVGKNEYVRMLTYAPDNLRA